MAKEVCPHCGSDRVGQTDIWDTSSESDIYPLKCYQCCKYVSATISDDEFQEREYKKRKKRGKN